MASPFRIPKVFYHTLLVASRKALVMREIRPVGLTWQSENTLLVYMSMWGYVQLAFLAADFKSKTVLLHGIKEPRGFGNKSF